MARIVEGFCCLEDHGRFVGRHCPRCLPGGSRYVRRELPELGRGAERDANLAAALELAALTGKSPAERVLVVLDHWSVFRPATGALSDLAVKLLLNEFDNALAATGGHVYPTPPIPLTKAEALCKMLIAQRRMDIAALGSSQRQSWSDTTRRMCEALRSDANLRAYIENPERDDFPTGPGGYDC